MDPTVGLAIQCVGIALVTVLTYFMRASIRNAAIKYWSIAWTCLSISLCSLLIGFNVIEQKNFFYSMYFLGEYAFGLIFVAGCRYYSTGRKLRGTDGYYLLAAVAIAAVLPLVSQDFNDLFIIQAMVMALLFAASVFALRPAVAGKASQGLRVMRVALMFLTVDFLHYVPIFAARKGLWGISVPLGYMKYTSIFDLILEILLGFGTVMILMETVRREVEEANRKLVQAHSQLELLAQMDPLTEALNRHAFHSLLSHGKTSQSDLWGCLAVIDVDNLKTINDSLGHNVGDKAIRAAARAVRSLIRADDMLFRWGGDEFLVLMCKLDESEAQRRMQSLNDILEDNGSQWTGASLRMSVSFGLAGFSSMSEIRSAIEQADREMYRRRQETRGSRQIQLVS